MDETDVSLDTSSRRGDAHVVGDSRPGARVPEMQAVRSASHITAVALTFANGHRGTTMVVMKGDGLAPDVVLAGGGGPLSSCTTTVKQADGTFIG
jgi:hypothetical protein